MRITSNACLDEECLFKTRCEVEQTLHRIVQDRQLTDRPGRPQRRVATPVAGASVARSEINEVLKR